METLHSFIVNTKNKFLTFSYKKRKRTLQDDVTLKPNSVTPEDIQDISKVIFQEGKKALQNMQNKIDKITVDRNEEVFRLKDNSEKLLTQIKKLKKDKKSLKDKLEHCIQEEVSKSPVVTTPLENKGTYTKIVNTATQEDDKSVEGKPHVAIQMMNISNHDFRNQLNNNST